MAAPIGTRVKAAPSPTAAAARPQSASGPVRRVGDDRQTLYCGRTGYLTAGQRCACDGCDGQCGPSGPFIFMNIHLYAIHCLGYRANLHLFFC
jgi:hypothetical protein